MQYTDAELKRWWVGLSKQAQLEVLITMRDKMGEHSIGGSLFRQYNWHMEFTPTQLSMMRKWHRD